MVTENKETCICPSSEVRSTHCPLHGSCLCAHGATCPNHDEPERFEPRSRVLEES